MFVLPTHLDSTAVIKREDHTLLLVDGSSYLYRAFYALPDMRNDQGEPTGAIYGLINMLRKLRDDFPAKYCACIFDARGKTFRDDIYPQYKGHRPPMPEDLSRQVDPIYQVVSALGWTVLSVPGVEADDVIGTLAVRARTAGLHTVVSTGDKDLVQLVNSQVTLVNTMSAEVLDPDAVVQKFGVPASGILDYLTLIGDTADNVPGVSKVGPKTALKWLASYGSLDEIMAHASDIKGAVGEHLRAALDWLPIARTLLTVKTDCDLSEEVPDFDCLVTRAQDTVFLRTFFKQQGFRSWLKELGVEKETTALALPNEGLAEPLLPADLVLTTLAFGPDRHYEMVNTDAQLDAWLQKIQASALTCVDTETTSLDPLHARIVGLSLSTQAGIACYIPLTHCGIDQPVQLDGALTLEKLKPWLEDAQYPKVGQNLKYDAHVLMNHGICLRGIVHDTLLQSYVLESHRSHDMDSLALRHLGETTIKYADVCGKGAKQIGFEDVEIAKATAYAAEDADITLRLHQALWPQIERDENLSFVYQQIELPALSVLQTIERNGVLIDSEKLLAQSLELGDKLLALETQVHRLAEQVFNLNSPKQVGEVLFTKLQLPIVKKTASGAPSTDEEVLQKLAQDYPLPKMLLDYRGLAKLKSTYTDKLPRMVDADTGRVHTHYAQAVAVTGRLASSDPNLQNIPVRTEEGRRIREAFIAAPGHVLLSADYSQIELRIMAHLSEDASLLQAFADGRDIHIATAAEIFSVDVNVVTHEQRRYAKVINFGLIYGMSAFGLASNLGIERHAAQRYIDTYFARYPGVARYMESTRQLAKQHGYVETVFGRRLWLPEINGSNGPRRQAAERAAINAPMQGTAADLIKLAMVAVHHWLDSMAMRTRIIMQVHDELILEVPNAELDVVQQRLPDLMCDVAKLKVPLLVEMGVGLNWEEAH
ncbi:MAG: DNA polymerase I [Ottowia sp.]|nr:DNA polymerase I [Ottowia sp.]